MELKVLFSFLFILLYTADLSAIDSAIFKLCETLDQDPNHLKAIEVINSKLQNKGLTSQEKVQLNSILIKKFLMTQKFDSCLQLAEEQVLIAKQENNPYNEAKFYNHIGNTYFYLSNSKVANQFYLKGEFIANKYQYIDLLELFNHNLGAISLENLKADHITEKYFLKAIAYSKINPKVKPDFALAHYRLLATLYWRQNKHKQAEQIYLKLISECQATKNTYQESAAKMFYSKLLRDQNKMKQALDMSRSALELAKPFKSVDIISTAYNAHAQNLKAANMPDSAYHYLLILQELVRNNYQEGLNQQISESAAKFKNAEIEFEKNVAIANAKRKTQLYLFISLGVVLMTIFGFLFYSNRKKVQLEKEQIKAVLLAEENERSRIARDLHDGIGQLLSAAKLNLHALENVNLVNKEIVLEKAIGLVDESAKEVRSVSHNLMPNALIKSGLVSAIKNFINQLETEQLKINIETSGLNKKINSEIELVVYRIIQECINNVIKHSKANHLFINLSINKNLLNIMIEDNGYGFDVDEILRKDGIGIKNMQARVAFLTGTMEIDSKLNKGTLFSFHVPLNIEKS